MTFENVNYGRVVRAVVMMFGASIVLTFLASCLMLPFITSEMQDRFSNILDLLTDSDTPNDQLDAELQTLVDDFGPELNLQYGLQWSLATLATFWAARWAAKRSVSPQQAAGYGLLVGLGVAFSYGVLCVMCSIALFALRLLFLGLLIGAGMLGGRYAGQRLSPVPDYDSSSETFGYDPAKRKRGEIPPVGPAPETFYNMGVMAALGGRREEARQHFTHVLQMQPRHLAAWLQLANLADNPEQAWNYVQQARMISPTDPAVLQAVELIWPQVAANAARLGPSPSQPPYSGAATNEAQIPRSTLPGATDLPLPPAITPPPVDDASGDQNPPAET